MKLPAKFREDDIVIFKGSYICPFGDGGSADVSPGTLGRVEKILYTPSRNQMFSDIHVTVVVAVMVGDIPKFLNITMDWAQEILEVKPAASALFGSK